MIESMIKNLTLLFAAVSISLSAFSQSGYATIDRSAVSVPRQLTAYKEIAEHLTRDLSQEQEKARALYIWIAHNIRYDLSKLQSVLHYNTTSELLDEVMVRRQGVCQHYAELFHAMANSVGLKTMVISGYTRQPDESLSNYSHAWNAVLINSEYYLIDATWAAGHVANNRYVHQFDDSFFLIEPETFIKTHIPFDPIWQFLDNPVSHNDFLNKDFSKLNQPGNFNYKHLIAAHEAKSETEQLEASIKRISDVNNGNKFIREHLSENQRQLTALKLNLAIDNMNKGVDYYNLYISRKNRQFRNPRISDDALAELINKAEAGIAKADAIILTLFSPDADLNRHINEVKAHLPSLVSSVEKEKRFVEKYLRTWKPFRGFLFFA
jgi:hypothetical protein